LQDEKRWKIDRPVSYRYIPSNTQTKALVQRHSPIHHDSESRSHLNKRLTARFCEISMLAFALAFLICVTLGPFLFGLFSGLLGNSASGKPAEACSTSPTITSDDDQYIEDYWAGLLLEKPYS